MFYNFSVFSQITEKNNLQFNGTKYDVVIIKIDSSISKSFKIIDNKAQNSEQKMSDSLSKKGLFFISTAGIVDADCNFIGLYINSGNKVADINLSDASSGNFFLKPNGFIGFQDDNIVIKKAEEFSLSDNYNNAVQSGPMLISDNAINAKFDKNSRNKNIRIAAGIYSENGSNFLVFAKSLMPVTFYQFAVLFSEKFKCDNALNLESGNYCSYRLPSSKVVPDKNRVVCKYLYLPLK